MRLETVSQMQSLICPVPVGTEFVLQHLFSKIACCRRNSFENFTVFSSLELWTKKDKLIMKLSWWKQLTNIGSDLIPIKSGISIPGNQDLACGNPIYPSLQGYYGTMLTWINPNGDQWIFEKKGFRETLEIKITYEVLNCSFWLRGSVECWIPTTSV